jgi:eukaryotic-like serine/threonine-protein kinase
MPDFPARDPPSVEGLLGQIADEFTERLNRGEQPDIEEYARRYPPLAAVLRQVLPALLLLRVSGADPPAAGGAAGEPPAAGYLGDYRILREVGRGGMGVVYEAVQVSLNRRVALKVLPFAAALDPKQLQRFQNEAQAAAHLHHTNIVPVFGIGCERSVHFYAMQFIEGHTLADLIRELRQAAGAEGTTEIGPASSPDGEPSFEAGVSRSGPRLPPCVPPCPPPLLPPAEACAAGASTRPAAVLLTGRPADGPGYYRAVARLGIQAAEALEHAHQLGVVHRDVKPANLMVDAHGNLWITDFGLAHMQSQAGLTMTGDLIGTLRYMSPEQALGKAVTLDHRTDVYSLGATLYELLTLAPALNGQDREELLRQIAFEEPRPPRRISKAIPPELETIVGKAMEKTPDDRYPTAQELADDLERYLKDEPIRARRPTLVQRARKWSRRHAGVVRTAAGALVVGVAALVVGLVVLWQAYDAKKEALAAEAREHQRAEASLRQLIANLKLAMQALDKHYLRVATAGLARDPKRGKEYQQVLRECLAFYEAFARQNETIPELRREMGLAYHRAGSIQTDLGRHREAEEAYGKAITLFKKLGDELAAPEDQQRLASTYNNRGLFFRDTGRRREAEQDHRRALTLAEKLAAASDAPGFRADLALYQSNLGTVLKHTDRRQEAEKAFRRAVELQDRLAAEFPTSPRYRRDLAISLNNLGTLLFRSSRLPEAEKVIRRALDLRKQLADELPNMPESKQFLAGTYGNWGRLMLDTRRPREAEEAYRLALGLHEKLKSEYPNVLVFRWDLANNHNGLGIILSDTGRHQEAEQAFGKALDLGQELVKQFPKVPDYQSSLGYTLDSLARLRIKQGQLEEARRLLEEAVRRQRAALAKEPRHPAYRRFLSSHYCYLAEALTKLGKFAEPIQALEQVIPLHEDLLKDFPKARLYRHNLASSFNNLGGLLVKANRSQEAEQAVRKALTHWIALVDDFPDMPEYRRHRVGTRVNLGHLLRDAGRFPKAGEEYRRALEDDPGSATAQRALGRFLANCPEPRLRDAARALELAQKAAAQEPRNPASWSALGMARYRAGDWKGTITALNQAMRLRKGALCDECFFLAMAHCQLGAKEQAGRWYDQGVQWMEANRPPDAILHRFRRFRAEAATLLGRERPPAPAGPAAPGKE